MNKALGDVRLTLMRSLKYMNGLDSITEFMNGRITEVGATTRRKARNSDDPHRASAALASPMR
jgi:hypothetical protein